jgi:tripartite-type tricarboxylate transporter receptor subunit TctC
MKLAMATTALAGVALLCASAASSATAQEAAFYRGKMLSVIVTSGSGGSVDLMSRLTIRHLGKHIPGNPSVIIKYLTGGGGIVGGNYLYHNASKDGTEIGAMLMTVPFEPLFFGDKSHSKFDPLKFHWLGSPAKFESVALSWHTSPVKKAEDLRTQELIVGSAGIGSNSTNDAIVMRNLLGFKYKVILGYPGGGDIDLAMMRGETSGRAGTSWTALLSRYPDWVAEKKINILYQMGTEKNPAIPSDVPLILEFAKTPEERAVLELKFAAYDLGYPVLAPPATPSERVETLRKALADTYRDPAFVADAKKARVDIYPVTGQRLHAVLEKAYSAPLAVRERLAHVSVPGNALESAKSIKVTGRIEEIEESEDGPMVKFASGGKASHALVASQTKVSINGQAGKLPDLKAGMSCDIIYFGDKGQATSVVCE